jgi:hypothetical protein
MDSFEGIIASLLERDGFWTRTSVKVELTDDDRRAIGRQFSPRWELDVVGYRGRDHKLLVLECKSFLDSKGVQVRTFKGENSKDEKCYKLFFEDNTREVVLRRLSSQLVASGFCIDSPRVVYGLAAGKIHGDVAMLEARFQERGWELWTPDNIRNRISRLALGRHENSAASVVAKMLLRESTSNRVVSSHRTPRYSL